MYFLFNFHLFFYPTILYDSSIFIKKESQSHILYTNKKKFLVSYRLGSSDHTMKRKKNGFQVRLQRYANTSIQQTIRVWYLLSSLHIPVQFYVNADCYYRLQLIIQEGIIHFKVMPNDINVQVLYNNFFSQTVVLHIKIKDEWARLTRESKSEN